MKLFLLATLVLGICQAALAIDEDDIDESSRQKKVLGLFNVVKFPNDLCVTSGNSNGTCYTSDECQSRGGKSDGSCASGYGVCCLLEKGCGSSTSENNTYLVMKDLQGSSCTYTVCPMTSNVCRIRLDFVTFAITGPYSTTDTSSAVGGAIGDCTTDRFSVTSSSSKGSPVICGQNAGQHMFVDVSSNCVQANFYIGSGSTTNSWQIRVTQYACGSEMGGPPGCLQYFTGTENVFTSFNYLATTPHHLSNQDYDICIRRELNQCQMCVYATGTNGFSFGLSAFGMDEVKSYVDTYCTTDYLSVHGATVDGKSTSTQVFRNCGRFLSTTNSDNTYPNSVCTRLVPFRISVKTNDDESVAAPSEVSATSPSGTYGFSLGYKQSACT